MSFLSRLFGSGSAVAQVDVSETVVALNDSNVQIVDCRWQREWNSGHIEGSKHIPLDSIEKRMNELDPDRPIIVVCRSGHRSSAAARKLASAGFGDVSSMKGGLSAWTRSGNTLVS